MTDLRTPDLDDLPQRHYGTILADPPWNFRTRSPKGRDRCPDARHYAVMTLEEIRRLLGDLAAKDSALCLWVLGCMLPEAIEIGRGWGFRYVTDLLVWVKTNRIKQGFALGLGYWTRHNTETCLLFTKGSPRRLSASVSQLVVAPRREHSRKPTEATERIEALLPGPRLELFAREPREGWDCWGNEVQRFGLAAE